MISTDLRTTTNIPQCEYCEAEDLKICVVPINKKNSRPQRCCVCNAKRQACSSFKAVDIVKKYPESTWTGIQEAKEEWSETTGRNVAELERVDRDLRSKSVKLNKRAATVQGKPSSKAADMTKIPARKGSTAVVTPGRRQSGRLRANKKRPASVGYNNNPPVTASPSKRTRTLPPRNATPGPSGHPHSTPGMM